MIFIPMIIQPKIRGFICTTAHPVGCAAHVAEQIEYVQSQGPISNGPKKVLVIGASTGYGLASRITAAFACGAATMGVFFEKSADTKRTATAGWYNSAAFENAARKPAFTPKVLTAMLSLMKCAQRYVRPSRKIWGKWTVSFIPWHLPGGWTQNRRSLQVGA